MSESESRELCHVDAWHVMVNFNTVNFRYSACPTAISALSGVPWVTTDGTLVIHVNYSVCNTLQQALSTGTLESTEMATDRTLIIHK